MSINSKYCIAAGLLYLLLFTCSVHSAAIPPCFGPCSSWQTNTTAKMVYSGLQMMAEMKWTLTQQPTTNANTELKNLVCFTYDSYKLFSSMLLEYHPDQHQHANISGLQFISWKTLTHSCQWLQNITETEAIDCTITGISNFCLAHRFHLLQQQLNKHPMISSSCYRNWLDENFPPPLTSDAVLKSISCRVQNGDYCC